MLNALAPQSYISDLNVSRLEGNHFVLLSVAIGGYTSAYIVVIREIGITATEKS